MIKMITHAAAAVALFAAAAFSQQSGVAIGVSGITLFPGGKYEDRVGVGFGGLGGVEVGGSPGLSLTARSGYIRHFERDNSQVSLIPFLGGIKASGEDGVVYLAGEFGAALATTHYRGPLALNDDDQKTNLAWGVGVGSAAGPLDLRFSFNVWDVHHPTDAMTIGLSFGFLIWGP